MGKVISILTLSHIITSIFNITLTILVISVMSCTDTYPIPHDISDIDKMRWCSNAEGIEIILKYSYNGLFFLRFS